MIYSYNKGQRDVLFLKFIFDKVLKMFRTDVLSIIRSLNNMYTARGIFHASYVVCLLATAVKITSVTNTYYCVYIVETPDDGQ